MEIQRLQEVVEAYHYDMKNPEIEVETEINVGLTPLEDFEGTPEKSTAILARLQFRLIFPDYVISGSVSQVNFVINREINEQTDITQQEVEELVSPLFNIVKRMTYEVTEIAMDEPGLELKFEANAPTE
ncbi:hypothetical protein SAMN02745116_00052 [Pilibacter termitis]|uniref:DUF1149 family protein n=1 Tax=Pilibacter termitis TaxID=263852 RepID=A0A1T4K2S1_9ENTE|nr:DUF1149 family protein [Pilibacter termitis]SJZ36708.1 hypothetical protein SAMN02745116_00052 [Pilibacter termitis]